jgi:hypothetical protein
MPYATYTSCDIAASLSTALSLIQAAPRTLHLKYYNVRLKSGVPELSSRSEVGALFLLTHSFVTC